MNKLSQTTIKIILLFFILFNFVGCVEESEKSKRFDSDGMLLLEGKRTFIIGSYYLPKTKTPFKTLAANGYNYVKVGQSKKQLDKAAEFNLMTCIYTNTIKRKSDTAQIARIINNFKDHPSLLLWEMEDEPAYIWNSTKARVSPQKMQDTYDFIKGIDSEHLIVTNHAPANSISTLQKYNGSTDIVECDVYPVIPQGIVPTYGINSDGLQDGDLLNPYISQVGEYVDKMKEVVNNAKPVFMLLQGFSWEMLKMDNEIDTSMILFPTYDESRFMAYNAIVHGANGVVYWGTRFTPKSSPFLDDLNKVTKELAEMQDVLAAKTVDLGIKKEYHELGYSVDTGVEIMTKEVNGKTYLLTVNSDKNPIKVTFSGLSGFNGVSILTENRKLDITDGRFTDSYVPFGVHIYEFE